MAAMRPWPDRIILSVMLPLLITGCSHTIFGPPVVSASTCVLRWDWVDNSAVTEYLVTVWPDQKTPDPPKHTHRVQAPNTLVPCATAGASHDGLWWATVQACTKKGICSEPSASFTFVVRSQ